LRWTRGLSLPNVNSARQARRKGDRSITSGQPSISRSGARAEDDARVAEHIGDSNEAVPAAFAQGWLNHVREEIGEARGHVAYSWRAHFALLMSVMMLSRSAATSYISCSGSTLAGYQAARIAQRL